MRRKEGAGQRGQVPFLQHCKPRIPYCQLARHTQMDFIKASDAVLCMARIPRGILAIHRTVSDAFMKSICVCLDPLRNPSHTQNRVKYVQSIAIYGT
ncbi:hypothetical protein SK128_021520 [Halocaridina rubra]|uniref:Uncharacterized protein n=1 Tax=Halocaridina rubra TaxID=373956 RepID=A0AAN8XCG9_HALRR